MRLFVALWPDDAVRAQLARWSRELHALCGGRATPPENLHVTLAFLGGIEDARVAEVERAAGEVAPQAVSLVLDQPGYWKKNRIAWAGASSVPRELDAMVVELRDAREPRAMPALAPIEWRLDGFALVQSVALPRGSRYEIRRSWKG